MEGRISDLVRRFCRRLQRFRRGRTLSRLRTGARLSAGEVNVRAGSSDFSGSEVVGIGRSVNGKSNQVCGMRLRKAGRKERKVLNENQKFVVLSRKSAWLYCDRVYPVMKLFSSHIGAGYPVLPIDYFAGIIFGMQRRSMMRKRLENQYATFFPATASLHVACQAKKVMSALNWSTEARVDRNICLIRHKTECNYVQPSPVCPLETWDS